MAYNAKPIPYNTPLAGTMKMLTHTKQTPHCRTRETYPTAAELWILLLEEELAGNVWDEGNAKLQHPAINQGLRRN